MRVNQSGGNLRLDVAPRTRDVRPRRPRLWSDRHAACRFGSAAAGAARSERSGETDISRISMLFANPCAYFQPGFV